MTEDGLEAVCEILTNHVCSLFGQVYLCGEPGTRGSAVIPIALLQTALMKRDHCSTYFQANPTESSRPGLTLFCKWSCSAFTFTNLSWDLGMKVGGSPRVFFFRLLLWGFGFHCTVHGKMYLLADEMCKNTWVRYSFAKSFYFGRDKNWVKIYVKIIGGNIFHHKYWKWLNIILFV